MTIELRPEVQRFAEMMEARLRENDHKGGWLKDGPEVIRRRLEANVPLIGAEPTACVDIANYAMMLADMEGAL